MIDHRRHQDKTLKAICLTNRKCTIKQMKNKFVEIEVDICDRVVRNRLKIGFKYTKEDLRPPTELNCELRNNIGPFEIFWISGILLNKTVRGKIKITKGCLIRIRKVSA